MYACVHVRERREGEEEGRENGRKERGGEEEGEGGEGAGTY